MTAELACDDGHYVFVENLGDAGCPVIARIATAVREGACAGRPGRWQLNRTHAGRLVRGIGKTRLGEIADTRAAFGRVREPDEHVHVGTARPASAWSSRCSVEGGGR